ncbi:hypothetical protein EVAR_81552_1 [Eumeta japonica]|uniref:Uncharacterized protein n=1 Tax=Eumeta variegata TaxID=151549 RepID=A0A4C1V0J6_EUMVA|nr:hypothetical protein EVAR_81552_1 [Eumeta japonica]
MNSSRALLVFREKTNGVARQNSLSSEDVVVRLPASLKAWSGADERAGRGFAQITFRSCPASPASFYTYLTAYGHDVSGRMSRSARVDVLMHFLNGSCPVM